MIDAIVVYVFLCVVHCIRYNEYVCACVHVQVHRENIESKMEKQNGKAKWKLNMLPKHTAQVIYVSCRNIILSNNHNTNNKKKRTLRVASVVWISTVFDRLAIMNGRNMVVRQ